MYTPRMVIVPDADEPRLSNGSLVAGAHAWTGWATFDVLVELVNW